MRALAGVSFRKRIFGIFCWKLFAILVLLQGVSLPLHKVDTDTVPGFSIRDHHPPPHPLLMVFRKVELLLRQFPCNKVLCLRARRGCKTRSRMNERQPHHGTSDEWRSDGHGTGKAPGSDSLSRKQFMQNKDRDQQQRIRNKRTGPS